MRAPSASCHDGLDSLSEMSVTATSEAQMKPSSDDHAPQLSQREDSDEYNPQTSSMGLNLRQKRRLMMQRQVSEPAHMVEQAESKIDHNSPSADPKRPDNNWVISFEQLIASVLTEPVLVSYFENNADIGRNIETFRNRRLKDRQSSSSLT